MDEFDAKVLEVFDVTRGEGGSPTVADGRDHPVFTTEWSGWVMKPVTAEDQAAFDKLAQIRSEAIEHTRQARELSQQRLVLIEELIAVGYNQSDIARELGVSRQSIQKMMAAV